MNLTPTMKELIKHAHALGAEQMAADVANHRGETPMTADEVLALLSNRGERKIQDEVKRRVR